jgi:hypothetical protein
MHDIVCPHCGKAFKIDEAGYADILKQVRDAAFEHQLHDRLESAEREKRMRIALAKSRGHEPAATGGRGEGPRDPGPAGPIAAAGGAAPAGGDPGARRRAEKDRDALASELAQARLASQSAVQLAEATLRAQAQQAAAAKDAQIQQLQAKLDSLQTQQKLAVREAVTAIERERDALQGGLQRAALEKELAEKSLQGQVRDPDPRPRRRDRAPEGHEGPPVDQDGRRDAGAALRGGVQPDPGHRLSECRISRRTTTPAPAARATTSFATDAAGTEIVSIMFEMKNESDRTATKNRNEDFLKELDRDRTEKQCEYAVLVSLLEPESELYNSGIVDVFHRYPKMYVIRPQFFIPMITLLRNAAMNALQYKAPSSRW